MGRRTRTSPRGASGSRPSTIRRRSRPAATSRSCRTAAPTRDSGQRISVPDPPTNRTRPSISSSWVNRARSTGAKGAEPLFADLPAIDSNGVLTFSLFPAVWGDATVRFRPRDDGGVAPNYAQNTNSPQPDDTADDVTFHVFVQPVPVVANDDVFSLPEDPTPNPVSVTVLDIDRYVDGTS